MSPALYVMQGILLIVVITYNFISRAFYISMIQLDKNLRVASTGKEKVKYTWVKVVFHLLLSFDSDYVYCFFLSVVDWPNQQSTWHFHYICISPFDFLETNWPSSVSSSFKHF